MSKRLGAVAGKSLVLCALLTIGISFVANAAPAGAEPGEVMFPNRSIRVVVPFPAGGSSDSIARALVDGLSKELGVPVYVDNRPGAATNIGSELVAKSRSDGYTLLFGGSTLVLNSIFGPIPKMDTRTALAPVSTVAHTPFVIATGANSPFLTMKDYLQVARAEAGEVTLGSAQLENYVERFKLSAKANVLHVPYRGGAQAMMETVAGQVDSVMALVPVLLPQLQSGKLRALGVSSPTRMHGPLAQVPTFAESGVDFTMSVWYGLQAPAGIDAERLHRLNQATRKVVESAEFSRNLETQGANASSSTPQQMANILTQLRTDWETLAKRQPHLRKPALH